VVQLKVSIKATDTPHVVFQFLVVQLKDFLCNCKSKASRLFQFLVVQLKDKLAIIEIYGVIAFQFLVVQLKASRHS